jgi:hypothetical protein
VLLQLILGIGGFILLLIAVIVDKYPSKERLFNTHPYIKWACYVLSVILVAVAGYCQFIKPAININNEVTVAPKSLSISGGNDKMYIIKVTNSKDTSIYDLYLDIEILNGDLTANDMKLEPLDNQDVTSPPIGDRTGSIVVNFDVMQLYLAPAGKNIPTIIQAIINNMNPRSTRNFKLYIKSEKIKNGSDINLRISHISEVPNPIISGQMPKKKE